MADDEVKIAAIHATVGDLRAAAQLALKKAKHPKARAEAEQLMVSATEALRRANGDERVKLRDIADDRWQLRAQGDRDMTRAPRLSKAQPRPMPQHVRPQIVWDHVNDDRIDPRREKNHDWRKAAGPDQLGHVSVHGLDRRLRTLGEFLCAFRRNVRGPAPGLGRRAPDRGGKAERRVICDATSAV